MGFVAAAVRRPGTVSLVSRSLQAGRLALPLRRGRIDQEVDRQNQSEGGTRHEVKDFDYVRPCYFFAPLRLREKRASCSLISREGAKAQSSQRGSRRSKDLRKLSAECPTIDNKNRPMAYGARSRRSRCWLAPFSARPPRPRCKPRRRVSSQRVSSQRVSSQRVLSQRVLSQRVLSQRVLSQRVLRLTRARSKDASARCSTANSPNSCSRTSR